MEQDFIRGIGILLYPILEKINFPMQFFLLYKQQSLCYDTPVFNNTTTRMEEFLWRMR